MAFCMIGRVRSNTKGAATVEINFLYEINRFSSMRRCPTFQKVLHSVTEVDTRDTSEPIHLDLSSIQHSTPL